MRGEGEVTAYLEPRPHDDKQILELRTRLADHLQRLEANHDLMNGHPS